MSISEEKQQEFMYKLSMFEQQMQLIQQQIEAIEQAVNETRLLNSGLEELKASKDREILATIGKGIYVKGKLLDDKLLVDVGGKRFVKKTVNETQETITEQIKKLEDVKKELENNLKKINEELGKIFSEYQEE
jgi:prefoldin alpha subunit